MISTRPQRSEIEVAGLRALHARQRQQADIAVTAMLTPYTDPRHQASMLRAIAAAATDQLAPIVGGLSVACLLTSMAPRFVPEITTSAHARAEELFTADNGAAA